MVGSDDLQMSEAQQRHGYIWAISRQGRKLQMQMPECAGWDLIACGLHTVATGFDTIISWKLWRASEEKSNNAG